MQAKVIRGAVVLFHDDGITPLTPNEACDATMPQIAAPVSTGEAVIVVAIDSEPIGLTL